jgi:hypothetical protein
MAKDAGYGVDYVIVAEHSDIIVGCNSNGKEV